MLPTPPGGSSIFGGFVSATGCQENPYAAKMGKLMNNPPAGEFEPDFRLATHRQSYYLRHSSHQQRANSNGVIWGRQSQGASSDSMSASRPGCVKTCESRERAEIYSQLPSPDTNRQCN